MAYTRADTIDRLPTTDNGHATQNVAQSGIKIDDGAGAISDKCDQDERRRRKGQAVRGESDWDRRRLWAALLSSARQYRSDRAEQKRHDARLYGPNGFGLGFAMELELNEYECEYECNDQTFWAIEQSSGRQTAT